LRALVHFVARATIFGSSVFGSAAYPASSRRQCTHTPRISLS
jgi:hypothetical protein